MLQSHQSENNTQLCFSLTAESVGSVEALSRCLEKAQVMEQSLQGGPPGLLCLVFRRQLKTSFLGLCLTNLIFSDSHNGDFELASFYVFFKNIPVFSLHCKLP